MSSSLTSFRKALGEAKHPVALAGAGLSAASGIPTFRGAGGLWRQHDALSLATPQAFRADPSKVWQFYHYRRSVVLRAEPNLAHVVLAKLLLDSDSARSRVIPAAQSFHLITQNVDGLSLRALSSLQSQQPGTGSDAPDVTRSDDVIEMHGNLFKTICTCCSDVRLNFDDPISPALEGTHNLESEYRPIPVDQLPRCRRPRSASASEPRCNGLLRPGVVWFGESIPGLERIQALIDRCDLILVLGTSATVYPAAGFSDHVLHHNGGKVAVFNIDPAEGCQSDSQHTNPAQWYFQGPVEKILPDILQL
ncbi:DHS-like NAD/FAD-binding domain-containing protein [Testicularia cyperi]|uniref:DHS-like NAD/FAD-binding domain-containing protein n=1 Tax=Testicularia cyperi TaxID=1882483 RepID=A0A317XHK8_9BASI|nr:DHS-like NAD/FAD-binding domain-containing protein [Testicularia cyperi]